MSKLAWCSASKTGGNVISIYDLRNGERTVLQGIELKNAMTCKYTYFLASVSCFFFRMSNEILSYGLVYWSHVMAVQNPKLLISLQHCKTQCANFEVFDLSKHKSVYTFGEIQGGKVFSWLPFNFCISAVVGQGHFAYHAGKNIAALIPVEGLISYHLFDLESLSILRKTKWNEKQTGILRKNGWNYFFMP